MFCGAQLGNSYHRLLMAKLGLKLKAVVHNCPHLGWLKAIHVQDPTITSSFACSISNRYDTLSGGKLTDWKLFVSANLAAVDSVALSRPTPR